MIKEKYFCTVKQTGYIYFVVGSCYFSPVVGRKRRNSFGENCEKSVIKEVALSLPLAGCKKWKILSLQKKYSVFQCFLFCLLRKQPKKFFWGSKYLSLISKSFCRNLFSRFDFKDEYFSERYDNFFGKVFKIVRFQTALKLQSVEMYLAYFVILNNLLTFLIFIQNLQSILFCLTFAVWRLPKIWTLNLK